MVNFQRESNTPFCLSSLYVNVIDNNTCLKSLYDFVDIILGTWWDKFFLFRLPKKVTEYLCSGYFYSSRPTSTFREKKIVALSSNSKDILTSHTWQFFIFRSLPRAYIKKKYIPPEIIFRNYNVLNIANLGQLMREILGTINARISKHFYTIKTQIYQVK